MKNITAIIETLRLLFPKYLLILMLYPLITGLVVNFELVEFSDFLAYLIWVPFFSLSIYFIKHSVYRISILSVISLISVLESLHWLILEGPFSLSSLLVITNSHPEESLSFIELKASLSLLGILPIFGFAYLSNKELHSISHRSISNFTAFAIIFISLFYMGTQWKNDLFLSNATPKIVNVCASFAEKINYFHESLGDSKPRMLNVASPSSKHHQNVVLVIGESASRNHMSIYGFQKITNPRLSDRNDLILFDNVVSPYSTTIDAVLSILSISSLDAPKKPKANFDLIDVFHSAGFETYWLSNQSPTGAWHNMIAQFAGKSDVVKFVNTTNNSSGNPYFARSYDELLFQPFKKALSDSNSKKFIIIHLLGSHTAYNKRYPDNFDHFQSSNEKEKIIAEYHNSILYNDFVLDSILNILKTTEVRNDSSLSSLVYLSDHGENLYDEQDKIGHDFSKYYPKSNVEIPFFVWLSDSYKYTFPEKLNFMKSNRHQPYVSDDLFHSMMDLSGISGDFYLEEKSILNSNFNPYRKRILGDHGDYDAKD